MICPSCHTENKDGAKFCNECGAPLTAPDREAERTKGSAPAHGLAGIPLIEVEGLNVGPGDADLTQVIGALDPGKTQVLSTADPDKTSVLPATAAGKTQVVAESDPDKTSVLGRTDPDKTQVIAEQDSDKTSVLVASDPDKTQAIGGASDSGSVADLAAEVAEAEEKRGGTDFSGLERLVDSSYVPPTPSWRDGGTMELPAIGDAQPPEQKTYQAPDPNEGHRGRVVKRFLIVLLVLALLAGGAAIVTYALELWGGKTVPDVTGEAQSDAAWVLEDRGFEVATVPVKSDEVEGIVLSSDPTAGSRQAEGATITLSVAVARTVPDLTGKTLEEAQQLMADEGFENVTYETAKSNEPEGTVLSSVPVAGEKAKASAAITVEVAESYTVPDVAGKSQADAQAALEAEGYEVAVATTYTESTKEGTALSTDPGAGTKLNSGSEVTLYVAKSRASQVVGYTQGFLKESGVYDIGGTTYKITSVDDVSYAKDWTANFAISAVQIGYLFGIAYENPAGSVPISGWISWSEDGSMTGSSPSISASK